MTSNEQVRGEEPRIGVFVCHCGGNISDVVDVKRVAEEIGKLPNVAISTTHMFLCSDPGQGLIQEKIRECGLNRVIVAACSPSLHELTFRRTLNRAGLNPYLFEHTNIREQVSWVVEDQELATQKTTRLIRAAVSRIRHLVPLEKRHIPIHQAALVIGGGVAGLTAARDLARRGIEVTLIERSDHLGGRMADLGRIFPTEDKAGDLLEPLIQEVLGLRGIRVYTHAEVEESTGAIGDFQIKIRVGGNGKPGEVVEAHVGVVILAIGLDEYAPREGEYGMGLYPQVITLLDLARELAKEKPGQQFTLNGRPIRNVAFVHCVGSRQHQGVHMPGPQGKINDYCSRCCCTGILHSACELKERYPHLNIYEFFEDIRAYGRGHEEYYTKASEEGVRFVRFDPLRPPCVEKDPRGESPLLVRSVDRLTDNMEVEVPADLVVLGIGLQARDMSKLIDLYRCSVGADRFLLEVHPKLRPVELAVSGVFLGGSAQGPMDITEATAAAAAAASKAAAMITQGEVEMDPFVARVNEELCTGCRICLSACPYDAISRDEEKGIAVISEKLCTGCGTCAASCPSNAIQQFGFNDAEVKSEVLALLGVPEREPVAA
jgi:heterodisulfide reductase subunit A